MKTVSWLVWAVVGFGLMFGAYSARVRGAPRHPWSGGAFVYGPAAAGVEATPGVKAVPAKVALLPAGPRAEAFLRALGNQAPGGPLTLRATLRTRLVSLSFAAAGIDAAPLDSGRLPEPGALEALGGANVAVDSVEVGGKTVRVVGRLTRDFAALGDALLVPSDGGAAELVSKQKDDLHDATLLGWEGGSIPHRDAEEALGRAFPAPKFTTVVVLQRLDRQSYFTYVAGLGLLLLGGSGTLISLYRAWSASGRFRVPGLAGAVDTLAAWPRLVWGVHLVYFGLVVGCSVLVYELPEFQAVILGAVRQAITSGQGPLGAAGKAYGSGNIPAAAAVTFVVNYGLGTLAMITVPSVMMPGVGALLAALRAAMWGFLLGPSYDLMARSMLPHSGTMLLEGEGYILATVFAVLVPVFLVRTDLGPTLLGRWGRALWVNVQGAILVALVLAVAAVYEAIEVIWMAS